MQKHIRENGNIIYGDLSKQINLKYEFKGKNNIIFFAGGSRNISMVIHGNNGLIFIGQNVAKIDISMVGESVLFIGDNSSFWGTTFRVLESKYIFLGNDCMFSWKINLETSDHHTICDILTNNRINFSKSIYIGDHVWCAQGVMIAKGAFIASGTMLGANSLAVSKEYYSNTVYAGSPAREIKKDIFWSRKYPGNYTKEQTQLNINIQGDDFKYTYNQNEFLSPKVIEEKLDSLNTAQEKLEFVYNAIYCNKNKNRFAYFKDMPYDIPLPKYENKFKSLKFEEIKPTPVAPVAPAKPAIPQPTPQELEIKVLKEQLAQKEQELINMKDKFDKQNTN
ncbi:MAG: acyltransferase, partial [Clostridia bacterium]|nr:acyltransferase [Clostridia bacterium]